MYSHPPSTPTVTASPGVKAASSGGPSHTNVCTAPLAPSAYSIDAGCTCVTVADRGLDGLSSKPIGAPVAKKACCTSCEQSGTAMPVLVLSVEPVPPVAPVLPVPPAPPAVPAPVELTTCEPQAGQATVT